MYTRPAELGERGSRAVSPRAGLRSYDAVTLLTGYVVVLLAIPSDRVVPALGGAGSPSVWFGLGAFLWWCWYQLQRQRTSPGWSNPVRLSVFIFLGAVLASYIAAMTRPISLEEANAADLGLIKLVGWAGVLLLTVDGVPNADRFIVLLRRLTFAGALMAALGLLQFALGQSLVDAISIPGLSSTQEYSSVQERSGFPRAAGTAMHPLEYAAVLSVIFPVALTLALHEPQRRMMSRWLPPMLILLALALSSSRSGLLGLVIGIVVLFPTWSAKIRAWATAAAVALAGAIYVLVPGMVGTLRDLFTNVSNDPSALSRTSSYELVLEFFERNPLFGRGFGTFLPVYRILDNEWLLLLMDVGLIGVAAVLGMVAASAASALLGRRAATGDLLRALGPALTASVLAGAVLAASFDAFSFPMAGGTFFLACGLCGAYWSVTVSHTTSAATTAVGAPIAAES